MEKLRPHYDLKIIQQTIRDRGVAAFTATALVGARAMGLDWRVALKIVCGITRANFFKSMTTHASSQIWQDVYHSVTPNGKEVYIKLTLRKQGSIVIQFKEK